MWFWFVPDLADDLHAQQTQINNIAEEVDFLEENDITQDARLGTVEDDVDEWDDKITALEVANVDIIDRLITVEEILLGNTCNLGCARFGEYLHRAGFDTSIVMLWEK